jgi:predicted dehydrogenase
MARDVEIVVLCDPVREHARRCARECGSTPKTVTKLDDLLASLGVDAALNLSPAPFHGSITRSLLEAGLHVYSEKPLANSVAEGAALIATADAAGLLLLCAPAVMAAPRFRLIQHLLSAQTIGRPTLACAQLADMGPAAWSEYQGDPTVFYSKGVGTLIDQGLYLLHAVVGLLGPARRVRATSELAIPERLVRGPVRHGETIPVEAPDHVMIHLELRSGAIAQILSSFAVVATRTPLLELHGELGSISISDHLSPNDPVNVFVNHGLASDERWRAVPVARKANPPSDLVGVGAAHFIACVRGEDAPRIPATDGLHVLEIVEAVRYSSRSGTSVDVPASAQLLGQS